GDPVVDKTGPLIEEYKAPKVVSSELSEPFASNDNVRGSKRTVHKKIFRGIEVACKKFQPTKVTDPGQAKGDAKVTDRFEPKISNFELSRSIHAWEDEPSARPSDMEMQQKLKDLFNEHVFSKGISPQINPKRIDSGDITGLELPRSFQEKVCITDSQESIEQFETPDECD
ncbi:6358_t:CDS:2, partial [Racocetra persica]